MIKTLRQNPFVRQLYHNKVLRYFFSAGTATAVDIVVYFLTFNYVLDKSDLTFSPSFDITAPTIALCISYNSGLFTNFFITKYFVFQASNIRTRIQFGRFVMVAFVVLVANFYFMHFLIGLGWYPTISRAVSAVTIGIGSFLVHRSFSFQVKKEISTE